MAAPTLLPWAVRRRLDSDTGSAASTLSLKHFLGTPDEAIPPPAGSYTVAWQGNTAAPTLPADGALTASSITAGAGTTLAIPYTGTAYDPNKVWSVTHPTTVTATPADAIANNAYHAVTISRTGGLVPAAIRVKAARGAVGTTVRGFRVRWSVDNYATDILGRDLTATTAESRPNLVQFPAAGDALRGDLTGTPTQTSITFRIYHHATGIINSLEFDNLEVDYATPATGPSNITVSPPVAGAAPSSSAPTVTHDLAVSPSAAVGSAPTLQAPSVTSGILTVSPTVAGSAPSLAGPTVGRGPITVSPPILNAAASGRGLGSQPLGTSPLGSGDAASGLGSQPLGTSPLGSAIGASVHAPTVTVSAGDISVSPSGPVGSAPAPRAPTVVGKLTIQPPLATYPGVALAPTVTGGPITVTPDTVGDPAFARNPQIRGDEIVFVATVDDWLPRRPKVWNGSAWVVAPVHVLD